MTVRRFPLRMTFPLGLALLLLTVLGVSLLNALNKRLGQLDQQAGTDILAHTAHFARMAEHGWETSRGLVEADLAEVATDSRAETVLAKADSLGVLAGEHDEVMDLVQGVRHFATFAFGRFLSRRQVNLDRTLEFSSPIYRLELGMIGRLFASAAAAGTSTRGLRTSLR